MSTVQVFCKVIANRVGTKGGCDVLSVRSASQVWAEVGRSDGISDPLRLPDPLLPPSGSVGRQNCLKTAEKAQKELPTRLVSTDWVSSDVFLLEMCETMQTA